MKDRMIALLKDSSQYIKEQDSLIERIADHLLANGVIVPPCKVGDTVYCVIGPEVKKAVIDEIYIGKNDSMEFNLVVACSGKCKSCPFDECSLSNLIGYGNVIANANELGKTIFLTIEEAEQALKGGAK